MILPRQHVFFLKQLKLVKCVVLKWWYRCLDKLFLTLFLDINFVRLKSHKEIKKQYVAENKEFWEEILELTDFNYFYLRSSVGLSVAVKKYYRNLDRLKIGSGRNWESNDTALLRREWLQKLHKGWSKVSISTDFRTPWISKISPMIKIIYLAPLIF